MVKISASFSISCPRITGQLKMKKRFHRPFMASALGGVVQSLP